jgi:hypothetical protein
LLAAEGTFVLAHHDGVERAVGGRDGDQQARGLPPVGPGDPPRDADVEVLCDDPPVTGDQVRRVGQLPTARR